MQKIYVLGGPRSGKTFFAKKLSVILGLPHFDLDRVVFQGTGFVERDEQEQKALFSSIFEKENWIIEGVYVEDWVFPALKSATLIIFIDTRPLLKLYRFIKQSSFGDRNLFGRAKLVLGFRYKEWDRSPQKYHETLSMYQDKVLTLRSKRQIRNYLESLEKLQQTLKRD